MSGDQNASFLDVSFDDPGFVLGYSHSNQRPREASDSAPDAGPSQNSQEWAGAYHWT
jgi:hypothetical protein